MNDYEKMREAEVIALRADRRKLRQEIEKLKSRIERLEKVGQRKLRSVA